ncbi:hypothetical protein DFJ43DRAFT_552456 [Lentinula guzmanii]|uniref:Mid2 domain-containing protein n=1 Tax=Lentinula guzmanii TaxID=2804957 RepID=A0AA38JC56_9AGAR|nr:hypothetical protein DFJ43DRAFT_552456 [Lentinula guzmanii]
MSQNFLEFNVEPTITVGQDIQAGWKWNAPQFPETHLLIMSVVGQSATPSVTTSTAAAWVQSGMIQLKVSNPGLYQATLMRPNQQPHTTFSQTVQFVAVLPTSTITNLQTTEFSSPTSESTSSISTNAQLITTISTETTIIPTTISSSGNLNSTSPSVPPTNLPTNTSGVDHNTVSLLVGAIFGALSVFSLLLILVYWILRRRRRGSAGNNSVSDLSSRSFYPRRIMGDGTHHFPKAHTDWDTNTESSLAPSDSVSRVVWTFTPTKKVRPLVPSTTLAECSKEQASTAVDEEEEEEEESVTTTWVEQSTASPFTKIPIITMTAATPSPPSTSLG